MRRGLSCVVMIAILLPQPASAGTSGFAPPIVTFGNQRQQIRNTPLLERPDRPLHVYGNTARRRHSRGAPTLQSGRR